MKTPFAAVMLAGLMLASPALAAAKQSAAFGTRLDPFGLALLGGGLTVLAVSRLLRRGN